MDAEFKKKLDIFHRLPWAMFHAMEIEELEYDTMELVAEHLKIIIFAKQQADDEDLESLFELFYENDMEKLIEEFVFTEGDFENGYEEPDEPSGDGEEIIEV